VPIPACHLHPRLSAKVYGLRRSAVSTIVSLCAHSRRNQASVLQHQDGAAYDTLMSSILPDCGDDVTQVGQGLASGAVLLDV
jgi:hypothetical protein